MGDTAFRGMDRAVAVERGIADKPKEVGAEISGLGRRNRIPDGEKRVIQTFLCILIASGDIVCDRPAERSLLLFACRDRLLIPLFK